MELSDLSIYRLSREISHDVWIIYDKLEWRDKKTMGDQWVSVTDSVGANIAEGFGRFHYLDKNKFNYNARGSLLEAMHWTEIAAERKKLTLEEAVSLNAKLKKLHFQLNNYIRITKSQTHSR